MCVCVCLWCVCVSLSECLCCVKQYEHVNRCMQIYVPIFCWIFPFFLLICVRFKSVVYHAVEKQLSVPVCDIDEYASYVLCQCGRVCVQVQLSGHLTKQQEKTGHNNTAFLPITIPFSIEEKVLNSTCPRCVAVRSVGGPMGHFLYSNSVCHHSSPN